MSKKLVSIAGNISSLRNYININSFSILQN